MAQNIEGTHVGARRFLGKFPLFGSGRFSDRIRRGYIVALALTASLSGLAFLALDDFIVSQDDAAAVINVAGRQRMLSQRISGLVQSVGNSSSTLSQWAAMDESDLDLLKIAVRQMSEAHEGLMNGNPARNLPGILTEQEAALYFSEPLMVDARVTRFLQNARVFIEDPTTEEAHQAASDMQAVARNDLLFALNAVVQFHEQVATTRAGDAEMIHMALLIATLLVLLAEGVVIFRPLVRELDASERSLESKQHELVHLSQHDALTGLLNRRALENILLDAAKGNHPDIDDFYAVITIDLDNFKRVNDLHGHAAGDELLRTAGTVLAKTSRGRSIPARIGGDEFVVLVPLKDIDRKSVITTVAPRIANALTSAFGSNERMSTVSASLGVAFSTRDGSSFAAVLANADMALYHAKASGKNQIVEFSRSIRKSIEDQNQAEDFVRSAIERNAFIPHFQPQVDMRTGSIVGIEALARATNETGEIASPDKFMKAAERSGQIVELGKMVIQKAIQEAATWHHKDIAFGRISVNASGQQLRDPDFVAFLERCLERHSLPAERLAVEVLESVLLEDENDEIVECCRRIRALGITLELDDFGTGYASIANVELLGVQRIKIDRSFLVQDASREKDLLQAVVTMAKGLNLDVLAEGVETRSDEERLMELGCYSAQGFHYARPMPADRIAHWLECQIAEANAKVA